MFINQNQSDLCALPSKYYCSRVSGLLDGEQFHLKTVNLWFSRLHQFFSKHTFEIESQPIHTGLFNGTKQCFSKENCIELGNSLSSFIWTRSVDFQFQSLPLPIYFFLNDARTKLKPPGWWPIVVIKNAYHTEWVLAFGAAASFQEKQTSC